MTCRYQTPVSPVDTLKAAAKPYYNRIRVYPWSLSIADILMPLLSLAVIPTVTSVLSYGLLSGPVPIQEG